MPDDSEVLNNIHTSLAVIEERMKNCVSQAEFVAFKSKVTTYGSVIILAIEIASRYIG